MCKFLHDYIKSKKWWSKSTFENLIEPAKNSNTVDDDNDDTTYIFCNGFYLNSKSGKNSI